ncbi:MAG: hypothetical protein M0P31_13635 [Solirubrobacteraceae bacterium]|nr:hypothetical protein [Solirubrobacteraceae bacterium]
MDDVVIAGLFTVIGVGVSGGIQAGLVAYGDWKTARGYRRQFEAEMADMLTGLRSLDLGPRARRVLQLQQLPTPTMLERRGEEAARAFRHSEYEAVCEAYTKYERIRHGVAQPDREAAEYAKVMVGQGVAALEGAIRAVNPPHRRPQVEQDLKELADNVRATRELDRENALS